MRATPPRNERDGFVAAGDADAAQAHPLPAPSLAAGVLAVAPTLAGQGFDLITRPEYMR